MGSGIRPRLLVLTFIILSGLVHPASAAVTVSGNVSFSSLDNGPLDEDPTLGVFAVSDSLVIEGTIDCSDGHPLPGGASACPVSLVAGGDLEMKAGSAIVAQNDRGAGNGGDVTLEVGGDLVLRGPTGGLPGARISTARTVGGNPSSNSHAGAITTSVVGDVSLEAGSIVSAAAQGGASGTIQILAEGQISVDGLVASGPSDDLGGDPLSGEVLTGGSGPQRGGAVTIRSSSSMGPGIQIGTAAVVVSQGRKLGAATVTLEACGIEIHGLVASLSEESGPSVVEVRSGEGLLVDGRDLGRSFSDPAFAGRLGAIRAGALKEGTPSDRAELFARQDVAVLGPEAGTTSAFAVSSNPGTKPHRPPGGTITVLSVEGSVTASGNAFEAGLSRPGNAGGTIDVQAADDVVLDGAALAAVGDFEGGQLGDGGSVFVRSFQGDVSWMEGSGDVRPVGDGVPAGQSGSVVVVYCGAFDLTGTAFPTVGAPVPPFPEVLQDCSAPGPVLPPGKTLPVCNQPPVAQDDDVTTDEDTPVAGNVLADNGHGPDSDPNGDPIVVTEVNGVAADVGNLVVLPSGALLTLNADGTFTYDPNGQFEDLGPGDEATDSFEYTIEDPSGLADSATVTVTITGVEDDPVAVDDTATVPEDSGATTLDVLANDTDVDGGPKSIQAVTQPSNGVVVITNAGADLTYEPNPGYCNDGSPTDDFTYTLNGGSTATVALTVTCVDDDPVAVADAAAVAEDSAGNAIDVLANDTDTDGGPKTVQSVTQPANGTVAITGGGTGVSYTPNADYCNDGTPTDDFTYTLNGGSTAAVSVTVTCVDDPPVAVADAASVNEDSGANAIDVLANDTDVDGGAKAVQSVTQPANGTVAITGGGTGVSYTPNANYCNDGTPTDDFSYTLNGGSSTTVSVTVTCVNDPPVAADDSFDFVGNTELRVDLAAAATPHALETTNSGFGALDNDADPVESDPLSITSVTVGACVDNVGPTFDCSDPAVGTVHMESDGRFSFEPAPGDADAGESFQYTLSDGTDSVTATVTLSRAERVWYVDNDTATAGVDGTSVDPFDTLAEAEAASAANDYVFVHFGDGASTGQSAGIALKDGQHLLGEHVGLSLPVDLNGNGAPTVLFAAAPGNRPALADTVAGGPDGVSAVNAIPAEVAGLALSGDVNALEWTTTIPFFQSGSFEIRDNVISGTGANGVDVNLAGTGSLALAFRGNSMNAAGIALNVQEIGAGTLTITAFDDNSVSGSTGGSGIVMANAIFDAAPGAPFETVAGGTTTIGGSGDGVGASGMVLSGVSGDLLFTDLDVFADGGSGLGVAGTGPVFLAGGTGLRFRVGAGVGTIEAIGGPAVDLSNLTANLELASLTSTSSPTTGVSLVGLTDGGGTNASFTAGTGSSIVTAPGASGPAFRVDGGNGRVAYAGTITNDAPSARAVSITSWSGDDPGDDLVLSGAIDENGAGILVNGNSGSRAITFSGGLDVDTTTGEGFAATSNSNALGVSVTGSGNTIDTVSATALRVTDTLIGTPNLTFRSLSSGNDSAAADPINGIVISNTGALGGLKVTGAGGAASGGTIQNTAGDGISLTSTSHVELAQMVVTAAGEDGIDGTAVTNFTLAGSSVTNNGNAPNEEGISFSNLSGVVSLSAVTATGNAYNNLRIDNSTGTVSSLAISGGSYSNNQPGVGNHGILIEPRGTSQIATATVSGAAISGNRVMGIQVATADTATVSSFTVSGNTIQDNQLGIDFSKAQASSLTFSILNNSGITGHNSHGINLFTAAGPGTTGTFRGRIEGNSIGDAGVPGSGSAIGNCMRINVNGDADAAIVVSENTFRQCPNGRGIEVIGRNGTGGLDVTVTSNDVDPQDTSGFPLAAILVQSNCAVTCNTVRADVRGNAVPAGATFDLLPTFIALVESSASTLQLVDTPPASATCTDQLTSNNTGSASASAGCALIGGPIETPP